MHPPTPTPTHTALTPHTHLPPTSHHITPNYTKPPHHTTPHQITPHQITSHHTTPHQISPHHTTPHHTTPHQITPHHTTPHHTTPHHTTSTYLYWVQKSHKHRHTCSTRQGSRRRLCITSNNESNPIHSCQRQHNELTGCRQSA